MSAMIPSHSLPATNRRLVLARRPDGTPQPGDFERADGAVPVCRDGQFLVRNLYLSVDPVQRGWAANPALTPLGEPMRALAVGIVIESGEAGVRPGEIAYGYFGWQDYAVVGRDALLSHIPVPRLPVSHYGGVLGMPGVTAWLALRDLAPPREGQTVLVSTAAGAVGSVVGQIARARGATVVGLTGSDDKVALCTERYGYHRAFNYKTGDLATTLAGAAANGFDTYFDNTGGVILDTAIRAMRKYGRIIQCGTAATPAWTPPPSGLRNEREILTRVLTWSGFFIFDHVDRFGTAIDALTEMVLADRLAFEENVEQGLDAAPGALDAMMAGANRGKTMVFVGDD